jgi:hypothetical protein
MSGRRLAEKKRVASIQYKTLMAPGKKCYLIAHRCTPECSFIGRSAAQETAYARNYRATPARVVVPWL